MKKTLSALGLGLGLLCAGSSWACDSSEQGFGVTNVQNEAIKIELQDQKSGQIIDGTQPTTIAIGEYAEICFAAKSSINYKMMQYRGTENLQYLFSYNDIMKDGYIGVQSNDPGFIAAPTSSAKKDRKSHKKRLQQ